MIWSHHSSLDIPCLPCLTPMFPIFANDQSPFQCWNHHQPPGWPGTNVSLACTWLPCSPLSWPIYWESPSSCRPCPTWPWENHRSHWDHFGLKKLFVRDSSDSTPSLQRDLNGFQWSTSSTRPFFHPSSLMGFQQLFRRGTRRLEPASMVSLQVAVAAPLSSFRGRQLSQIRWQSSAEAKRHTKRRCSWRKCSSTIPGNAGNFGWAWRPGCLVQGPIDPQKMGGIHQFVSKH